MLSKYVPRTAARKANHQLHFITIKQSQAKAFIIIIMYSKPTGKAAHLSAAELEEDVDVVLIFKMMRKLDHMFVQEGFMQLNFIGYLTSNHSMAVSRNRTNDFINMKVNMTKSTDPRLPCLSGEVWTLCFVESLSQHTSCCWKDQSSHNSEQTLPATKYVGLSTIN